MLTLQDCLDHCDIRDELCDDIAEIIARHEHITFLVAVEKAYSFMNCEWGRPAIRQMIADQSEKARLHGNRTEQNRLEKLGHDFERCYPGGRDRRLPAWRPAWRKAQNTSHTTKTATEMAYFRS